MIALQVLFVAILLGVFAAMIYVAERDLADTIVDGLSSIIQSNGTVSGSEVLEARAESKNNYFLIMFGVLGIIAATFGYLLSSVTLRPARNALAAQKQFIGDIAHELRTPLAIIKTNAEVALMDPDLAPDLRKMLKSNIDELNRASEIINNLLSLNTFIRTERMQFDNIDLGLVIDRVVEKLDGLAGSKSIDVTVQKSEYRTVWGNETALVQVVTNLLKNALNYTPEGGHVTASIEPDYQGAICFSVKDTGVGIAQKDLFRIFEPFYRADRSRNRAKGSSGLGLTIVSEIVKLHRGTITIKSAPNKGTTVTVTLPSGKTAAVEPPSTNHAAGEISVDFSRTKATQ